MATIHKRVILSESTMKAFERHFPETSLSWCLDMLLERFVAQYQHTPQEYAARAAEELKSEIES